METVIILAAATGLSAWIVWRAVRPPDGRPRKKERHRSTSRRPNPTPRPIFQTTGPEPVAEDRFVDGFAILPAGPSATEDRPPRSVSLIRLALTIAFVAVLVVAALAIIGFLVKAQLDQYFTS